MINPIRKSITVPLNPTDAFTLFTEQIHEWWPGHTFSVSAYSNEVPKTIVFESFKDGEIFELTADNQKHVWGNVIAYDVGAYLAFTWFPGRTATEATVVTVSFKAADGGTQCELTHGGFGVLGDDAEKISSNYVNGWDAVLAPYINAA